MAEWIGQRYLRLPPGGDAYRPRPTQAKLGAAVGKSKPMISRWENEGIHEIRLDDVRWAQALDVMQKVDVSSLPKQQIQDLTMVFF
jgi:transcriptional regulator with XRE-family HTH domain